MYKIKTKKQSLQQDYQRDAGVGGQGKILDGCCLHGHPVISALDQHGVKSQEQAGGREEDRQPAHGGAGGQGEDFSMPKSKPCIALQIFLV